MKFWAFFIINFIIALGLFFIELLFTNFIKDMPLFELSWESTGYNFVLLQIWNILTILPSLALYVRRLHDLNKSAWWLIIYPMTYVVYLLGMVIWVNGIATKLVVGIEIIWLLFILYQLLSLYFQAGEAEPNKYGVSPIPEDNES